jgi:serine/threonine-protein kinase
MVIIEHAMILAGIGIMYELQPLLGQMLRTYRVERVVGGGGQGIVLKGFDTEQSRAVALKVIRPDERDDMDAIKRFQVEATVSFRLRHACLVPLYAYWRDDLGIWMVMRWMEGGNLRDKFKQAPLTLRQTYDMLVRVCEGLTEAHTHDIIHRDIKPDNILFDENEWAYLSDFGAAKRLNAASITKTGAMVGTPGYAAPESIETRNITKVSDIFSLGVVLFESLSGLNPFSSGGMIQTMMNLIRLPTPNICDYRPEIPPEVNDVIQIATAKKPDQRFQTPAELLQAFLHAAG